MQELRLSKINFNLGNPIHYSDSFRDVVLAHKQLIQKLKNTTTISINQWEADKYYGDFYGLLHHKGVNQDHFWLVTVLNGLNCSSDYNSDFLEILVPDSEYIEKLVDIYNTKYF